MKDQQVKIRLKKITYFRHFFIKLKNVMKVCIYLLCYTIPKTGVFTDICTYCKLIKSTVFLNSSISNQMFIIVNSVNNSGIAGGMQSGRISSNNNCKSLTAERYTQFSVLVWDCSIM